MTTPAPKYGCHNRAPYKPLTKSRQVGQYQVIDVKPFNMAEDCQFTKTSLGQADVKCVGCSWRQENPKQ